MLNEEALVLLGTLVACGLLILGVLDLVWPARRPPVRRTGAIPPRSDRRAPVERELPSGAMAVSARPDAPATAGDAQVSAIDEAEAAETPGRSEAGPGRSETGPALARESSWVLDRCRALAAEERFADVITTATVALEQPELEAGDRAALWREVAVARTRGGDPL